MLLAAASFIGLAAIAPARSSVWEQRGWTTTMARLATLFIVGAVGLAFFQPPAQPANTLAVGIHDAGWIRSWPSGVTPIPPPPMTDESFVIGTGVAEDRVGALRVRGSVLRRLARWAASRWRSSSTRCGLARRTRAPAVKPSSCSTDWALSGSRSSGGASRRWGALAWARISHWPPRSPDGCALQRRRAGRLCAARRSRSRFFSMPSAVDGD